MAHSKTLGKIKGPSVADQRDRIGPKVSAELARKRVQELTQDLRTRNLTGAKRRGSSKTSSGNKRK